MSASYFGLIPGNSSSSSPPSQSKSLPPVRLNMIMLLFPMQLQRNADYSTTITNYIVLINPPSVPFAAPPVPNRYHQKCYSKHIRDTKLYVSLQLCKYRMQLPSLGLMSSRPQSWYRYNRPTNIQFNCYRGFTWTQHPHLSHSVHNIPIRSLDKNLSETAKCHWIAALYISYNCTGKTATKRRLNNSIYFSYSTLQRLHHHHQPLAIATMCVR